MNIYETKSKLELVTDICAQLNERGMVDNTVIKPLATFNLDSGFIKNIRYLPKENLIHMLHCMRHNSTPLFKEMCADWERNGAFKFAPIILRGDEFSIPTLMLKCNCYVSLNNNSRFQMTNAWDGSGLLNVNSYALIEVISAGCGELSTLWTESLFTSTLCYAAFIDVCAEYPELHNLLSEYTAIVDEFVHESLLHYSNKMKYNWNDVEKLITYTTDFESILSTVYKIYSKDKLICEYITNSKFIQVRTREKGKCIKVSTLHIPQYFEGVSKNSVSPEKRNEFVNCLNSYVSTYQPYIKSLLVMLLTLNGIHVSHSDINILTDLDTLPATNTADYAVVTSLSKRETVSVDNTYFQ